MITIDTSKGWTVVTHMQNCDLIWLSFSMQEQCSITFGLWAVHKAFSTLRPRQNGGHFPDDILRCIFWNENVWISIKISPKSVPEGPNNNIPALVQIMAWCRPVIYWRIYAWLGLNELMLRWNGTPTALWPSSDNPSIVKRRAWMENNDQIGGGVFVTTPLIWSLFSVKTNFIPSSFSTPFSE